MDQKVTKAKKKIKVSLATLHYALRRILYVIGCFLHVTHLLSSFFFFLRSVDSKVG